MHLQQTLSGRVKKTRRASSFSRLPSATTLNTLGILCMARAKLISPSDVALSASDQLQAIRSACPIDPARDVEKATETHLDDRPSLTTGRPLEKLCPLLHAHRVLLR